MRPILSATRSLLAEPKISPYDWTAVIPQLVSALNESPIDLLVNHPDGKARCPLEVMTGITPKRPILRVLPHNVDNIKAVTIAHTRSTQLLNIKDIQKTLYNMHKDVENGVNARRARPIRNHNKATNIVTPTFSVGDFVLVRRATDRGHKLNFKWIGTCRITSVHGQLIYGSQLYQVTIINAFIAPDSYATTITSCKRTFPNRWPTSPIKQKRVTKSKTKSLTSVRPLTVWFPKSNGMGYRTTDTTPGTPCKLYMPISPTSSSSFYLASTATKN